MTAKTPGYLVILGAGLLGCSSQRLVPVARGATEPPRSAPERPGEMRLYHVRAGDTLSIIAARFGLGRDYARLARLNRLRPPYLIRNRQTLKVPALPPRTARLLPYPRYVKRLPTVGRCGKTYPPPRAVRRAGCPKAHCVRVAPADAICECWSEGGSYRFVYERGRTEYPLWRGRTLSPTPGRFEVARADLDGDGRGELSVVREAFVTLGASWVHNTVGIIDPRRIQRRPLLFGTVDGADTVFARVAGRPGCLVTSRTREYETGARGEVTYLVARFYRYRRGALVPDRSLPVLRQGLYSGAPAQGLSKEWEVGHLRAVPRLRGRIVKISSVAPGADAPVWTPRVARHLWLSTRSGPRVRLHRTSLEVADESKPGQITRLGHRASQRLFPIFYEPSDPRGWLRGAGATLTEYRLSRGLVTRVLWIGR